MNRNWIMAGVVAFGMAGVLPATSIYAKEKETKKVAEKEYDESIRYRDLPKPVQETVDKEAGDHKVKSFWHVFRDGKEFYRAVIDTKGDDKVIRMKPGGALLSEEDAKDLSAKDLKGRTVAKPAVVLHGAESEGEEVEFDRLPGAVKAKIGSLAKGDKIDEVVRYKHRGATMYRAEVGTGKYTRFIRVAETGEIERVSATIDPGEKVDFNRLPGAVKSKIGALAKSDKVENVIEYKRGAKTYYQAEIDERGPNNKNYFITVDGDGKEVDGLPKN